MFKVEKGIPIPPHHKPYTGKVDKEFAATLDRMDVGDSFVITKTRRSTLHRVLKASLDVTKKFTTRKVSETEVRIFRIV